MKSAAEARKWKKRIAELKRDLIDITNLKVSAMIGWDCEPTDDVAEAEEFCVCTIGAMEDCLAEALGLCPMCGGEHEINQCPEFAP